MVTTIADKIFRKLTEHCHTEPGLPEDEFVFTNTMPFSTPYPRAGLFKPEKRKRCKIYYQRDSESESEEVPIAYTDFKSKTKSINPSTGPRKYTGNSSLTNLRTLYSHFPVRYFRTILSHILLTIVFFMFLFPSVNFVWTYMATKVDHEMDRLLHYISDDVQPEDNLVNHFNRMEWLCMPTFTVETVTLLLSAVFSDLVCLRWLQELENISLSKIVESQMVKKYY